MYEFRPPAIDWLLISPVCVVMLTGILALILEMLQPKRTNNGLVMLSLAGLIAAGGLLVYQMWLPSAQTFGNMALRDPVSTGLQLLLVGACLVTVLFSESYLREKRIPYGEFYPLVLWSTAGGMLMVGTTNLLMLFIGLEVLSIALYVLAGMSRREAKSEESAIKYFLLGAFASGFLLYGIAFVYGATGSLQLEAITAAWQSNAQFVRGLLGFGLGLMLVGLGFKAALVPFHQWTPDVYQGAPTNVTGFMAAGSKIAALGALFRVLEASIAFKELWLPMLNVLALLTMVIGNLIALQQKDVKRILGYSSIANAGYALVALIAHFSAPERVGLGATVFFLLAYSLMTLGAFAALTLATRSGQEGTRLSDLYGLWQRAPLAAVLLIIFCASLIGVPPTAGFFGKLLIFGDALLAGQVSLAIVLAIGSVISVYYYLGIVQAVFVAEPETAGQEERRPIYAGLKSALLMCAAGTLVAGSFAGWIRGWTDHERFAAKKPATEAQVLEDD